VSYQLELAPGAIEDLAAAAEWYERNSPTSGEKLVRAIGDIMIEIRERPEAWPRLAHRPRIRARVVRRLRYRIIYEILDRTIVVHAIAHTSSDPGYWLDRVT
jgi:plasmid stabilization system protein ParE